MNSINLLELIPRAHAGSRAKGFWDVTPNQGQQLMLVISELAEALEADRKGRDKSGLTSYYHLATEATNGGKAVWGEADSLEQRKQELFAWKVKDTVADELADAYIRLCDYVGGYGLRAETVAARTESERPYARLNDENLGAALAEISRIVLNVSSQGMLTERTVGEALSLLEALATREGIDLATHIDLKLRYNATRPAKHGKAY